MWYNRLRGLGILGINARNASYTLRVNPREYYPLVDDKLLTKQLAMQHGIGVPELYGVIYFHHQISDVLKVAALHRDFVVKPSMGSEGEGILILSRRNDGSFQKPNREVLSPEEVLHYISGILSGLYSLGGQDDKALMEYRVETSPVFAAISSYQGVPDIRVIVYRGVPVMSMLRLPTTESNGKANLHQGAVGVGIELGRGTTLHGVHHDRIITAHPDTGESIQGLTVPFWEEILTIAVRASEITKLGYVGVDVVIDKRQGPMILECNARPGLSIQIANQAGLLFRLDTVDLEETEGLTMEERISLGKSIAQRHHSRSEPNET